MLLASLSVLWYKGGKLDEPVVSKNNYNNKKKPIQNFFLLLGQLEFA